jgi:hypothetical protein
MVDEIAKNQHVYEEAHVVQTAPNFLSKSLQSIRINEMRITPDATVFLNSYVYIYITRSIIFPLKSTVFLIRLNNLETFFSQKSGKLINHQSFRI